MLIPRAPTSEILSDTSYGGIGGWGPDPFLFFWRLTREELVTLGFPMHAINAEGEAAKTADPDNLHINVLEFIAIIINIWIALTILRQPAHISKPGGHIVRVLADNTSALSWLRYALRSH